MLRLVVAGAEPEVADAQRVRFRVYCEEERLLPPELAKDGRERDARDTADTTTHLLVYADNEPVGTVRLCASRAVTPPFGLELEARFRLQGFDAPGIRLAEVTRYCVVRRMRGTRVTPALFAALRRESLKLGVTHWVAAANMETDRAEDAAITHRLLQGHGLMSRDFLASPRATSVAGSGTRCTFTPEERRCADRGELSALRLPKTLSLFAQRLGARCLGPPAYDACFNVFAAPLVVDVASLGARSALASDLAGLTAGSAAASSAE